MDLTSKTDPLLHVSLLTGPDATPSVFELGYTERIKNDENPTFTTSFTVDYYFEIIQKLKIVAYDSDGPGKKVKKRGRERERKKKCIN